MIDYSQAGVDIHEGYRAVGKYKEHAARTRTAGVLNAPGSFAGMFALPPGMREPVLVSGTDGIGTKLDIAMAMGRYGTVGIDCAAMCVNDILCHGAKPLFFLDYIACGKLNAETAAEIVKGIADGCEQAGCALLGGETAEMPGFYADGRYDVAGFAVGVVEKSEIISGGSIREGDALIGIASSGVHSNGFSLIRKLITDYTEVFQSRPIWETLLEPTKIYVKPVLGLMEKIPVHGMAHITGGGFHENIPRMYPEGSELVSVIEQASWPVPEIFGELVRRGADPARMFNTFNMGIGFVLAVSSGDAREAADFLTREGFPAWQIGSVKSNVKNIEGVILQ